MPVPPSHLGSRSSLSHKTKSLSGKSPVIPDAVKRKTELCKHWIQGSCPYVSPQEIGSDLVREHAASLLMESRTRDPRSEESSTRPKSVLIQQLWDFFPAGTLLVKRIDVTLFILVRKVQILFRL